MRRKNTFITAEVSANHNGCKQTAVETIKAAKRVGADAVKLQTYTADTLTLKCKKKDFKISHGTLWDDKYFYDLYQQAYTPWEWHEELFRVAREEGLECFSTPFDKTAVDFLESLNNPIYKIASFEITDIPLIEYAARKGKPMVISTGIATEEDIQLAVDTCRGVGNDDITLLRCVSAYPAPLENVNLKTMLDMKERFGVKVGLSDHTMGSDVAIAATALGAEMIEKHFILDRSIGGPDAPFSMTVPEFQSMVQSVRNVEIALGDVNYPVDVTNIKGRDFCRSLYVAMPLKKGDVITEESVRSVRPGYGMHPKYLKEILGRKVNQSLEIGDRMNWDVIDG